MRNLLARVPKSAQAMVAATVRTIFDQPDRVAAEAQLLQVVEALAERFPAVTQLLLDAEGEILTFYDFPPEPRRQIYSTNPLERLNKELKRRSAVVGIFPNRAAVLRLFGALLAEQNDEWLVAGHRYMSEVSLRKLFRPPRRRCRPTHATPGVDEDSPAVRGNDTSVYHFEAHGVEQETRCGRAADARPDRMHARGHHRSPTVNPSGKGSVGSSVYVLTPVIHACPLIVGITAA
jgi:hypothetical protein